MPTRDRSLAPEEIDRLEDALERWTDAAYTPGPEDSLLPTHLRARLDAYREVLAHTRATLPIEEVDDDLLAAVQAEARRGASRPRRAANRPGLWERLRRSLLVPGLALAGSAALLLRLVQPDQEQSLRAPPDPDAPSAREEVRLAQEPGPAPAAPSPIEADRSLAAPPPAATNAATTTPPAEPKAADRKPERAKKAPPRDAAPAVDEEPGLADSPKRRADKEELRDTLDRADRAYQRGDCESAMTSYLAAMAMAGAPSEEARSMAGYALCLQRQGDAAKADKYLGKARGLWSGIDAWIADTGVPAKQSPAKPTP